MKAVEKFIKDHLDPDRVLFDVTEVEELIRKAWEAAQMIDFDYLESKRPDLAEVWPLLRQWFDKNHQKLFIEESILVQRIKHPSLNMALQFMTQQGALRVAYRGKSVRGDLLEGDFDRLMEVPEKMLDRDGWHGKVASVVGYAWGRRER